MYLGFFDIIVVYGYPNLAPAPSHLQVRNYLAIGFLYEDTNIRCGSTRVAADIQQTHQARVSITHNLLPLGWIT